MKKHLFNKIVKLPMLLIALFFIALSTTGCSSLSYVGEDFNENNVSSVQTNEEFYFSTYNKTSADGKFDLKIGTSKTPLPEVLAIYFELNNNSQDEIIIDREAIKISSNDKPVMSISTSNYISAYQSSQSGQIAALSQSAGAMGNIANMMNNYQQTNMQRDPALMNSQITDGDSSFREAADVSRGIVNHTIKNIAIVKGLEKRYFYLFIKDPQGPIQIDYKDLSYTFMVKGND